MAIHNEGKKPLIRIFIVLLLINVVITYFLPDTLFAVIVLAVSLILFGLSMNFYKKPNREYKGDLHGLVNAPTDGRIVAIEKVFEKDFFNDERIQISIFMTFFNAHSNWIPVSGKVVHCSHVPGNFYAAYLPKSSTENEHSNILIETPEHGTILTKQIAGAIARRIVTYVKEGEIVHIGSPLGFIKLGSRMDIYLPLDSEILVNIGEEVRANVTFLARLTKEENK
ncbi:MAG TPA: phosphatidylserine decarboxylase family protein [Fermentimonas caenicola]|jgi:phosphatidylserine decarboxylase|uniref:phosphatidylserine decarboxylase family protein n=1 Tax=Lascolabacillus TaxID=1924067 RepID=UPI0006B30DC7|nr:MULTISPECIES: phosphatidylserine decarboxylase family protein [Lascolabacillus]MBP6176125.1 phosphatidylserine decarboxylase family protein [Fermentimonas sp.]MDI9625450.1 phosphatidylserine decarboxylase family protein [Bacteroidota bacterium]TAH60714.1 MAG: phosphatidylserine decarboxylase family protein [Fermentimonas caenicola]MBP6197499.1 phosphatidylserine decarboxylase family protein [Fermentimonas sp.]MBP7105007.1 phosphatidylserine decarboxylase family protein [Fermentimonas sp.]